MRAPGGPVGGRSGAGAGPSRAGPSGRRHPPRGTSRPGSAPGRGTSPASRSRGRRRAPRRRSCRRRAARAGRGSRDRSPPAAPPAGSPHWKSRKLSSRGGRPSPVVDRARVAHREDRRHLDVDGGAVPPRRDLDLVGARGEGQRLELRGVDLHAEGAGPGHPASRPARVRRGRTVGSWATMPASTAPASGLATATGSSGATTTWTWSATRLLKSRPPFASRSSRCGSTGTAAKRFTRKRSRNSRAAARTGSRVKARASAATSPAPARAGTKRR